MKWPCVHGNGGRYPPDVDHVFLEPDKNHGLEKQEPLTSSLQRHFWVEAKEPGVHCSVDVLHILSYIFDSRGMEDRFHTRKG